MRRTKKDEHEEFRRYLDRQYTNAKKSSAVRATERAEELLKSVIGEEAYANRQRYGWFEIVGSDGNTYRIGRGFISNVWRMDGRSCCVQIKPQLHRGMDGYQQYRFPPEADHHLAQVMLLKTDAKKFRRISGDWDFN